jgi:hypothetical protein
MTDMTETEMLAVVIEIEDINIVIRMEEMIEMEDINIETEKEDIVIHAMRNLGHMEMAVLINRIGEEMIVIVMLWMRVKEDILIATADTEEMTETHDIVTAEMTGITTKDTINTVTDVAAIAIVDMKATTDTKVIDIEHREKPILEIVETQDRVMLLVERRELKDREEVEEREKGSYQRDLKMERC